MQKNEAYHESAIKYNEGLAKAAEELAPTIEHEEPRRWCIAVGKQHRFHAKRHKSALEKLRNKQEAPSVERILDGLDVPDLEKSTEEKAIEQMAKEAETFNDGCVGTHKPLEPSCDYYPKEAEA